MKKSRYTEEQIIQILNEAQAGMKVEEICRKYGISDGAFYNWKSKFGGLTVSEAQRLRTLEGENSKLDEARRLIEKWREEYNHFRPHSVLNGQTPNEVANSIIGLLKERTMRTETSNLAWA
jgi:putative transposase